MTTHRLRVPLRWVDLDAQGHANNAAVVDYLQEARVRFLLDGRNAHLLGNGVIVVGHQVEYLGAIAFTPEPLDVDLCVADVGASQFTVGYVVSQGGLPVARARTKLCTFDFEAGRPGRMAAEERDWFRQQAGDAPELRPLHAFELTEHHHTYPFHVRWSDMDSYGHANNTRFYDYVAEARVALKVPLLENSIRTSPHGVVERSWLVARQDMRYLGQVPHRLEPYEVHTGFGATGRTSMTVAAEIVDPASGQVMARSTTVLVHADPHGRPQPLPAEILEAARAWPATDTGRGLL